MRWAPSAAILNLMKTATKATKSEVLSIIEAYEGLIRQNWNDLAARAKWTEWKMVLCRLEGR